MISSVIYCPSVSYSRRLNSPQFGVWPFNFLKSKEFNEGGNQVTNGLWIGAQGLAIVLVLMGGCNKLVTGDVMTYPSIVKEYFDKYLPKPGVTGRTSTVILENGNRATVTDLTTGKTDPLEGNKKEEGRVDEAKTPLAATTESAGNAAITTGPVTPITAKQVEAAIATYGDEVIKNALFQLYGLKRKHQKDIPPADYFTVDNRPIGLSTAIKVVVAYYNVQHKEITDQQATKLLRDRNNCKKEKGFFFQNKGDRVYVKSKCFSEELK